MNSVYRNSKESFIENALMVVDRGPKILGHCASYQKVGYRKEFGPLAIQPLCSEMILALWTVAVSAGMIVPVLLAAFRAVRKRAPGVTGSASHNGIKGTSLFRQETGAIALLQLRPVTADQFSQLHLCSYVARHQLIQ